MMNQKVQLPRNSISELTQIIRDQPLNSQFESIHSRTRGSGQKQQLQMELSSWKIVRSSRSEIATIGIGLKRNSAKSCSQAIRMEKAALESVG